MPEAQQIVITRDDVIRPRRDRAFKNPVIRRVFLNHAELHRRHSRPGYPGNPLSRLCNVVGLPTELSRQNAADFVQDRFGHNEIDLTRARQLQELKRPAAWEHERRDKYICIGSDARHSSPVLPIFGAVLRNQAIHIAFRDAHIPRPSLIAFDELHPALLFEVLANGVRSQFVGGAVLRLCRRPDLRKQRSGKRDISSGHAHILILAEPITATLGCQQTAKQILAIWRDQATSGDFCTASTPAIRHRIAESRKTRHLKRQERHEPYREDGRDSGTSHPTSRGSGRFEPNAARLPAYDDLAQIIPGEEEFHAFEIAEELFEGTVIEDLSGPARATVGHQNGFVVLDAKAM